MSAVSSQLMGAQNSVYLPEAARVVRLTSLTQNERLLELALERGRPLGHTPGQFVQCSLPGIGECPISICSSPTRPQTFELCVRRVGSVTERLHRLAVGASIGIRGPFGRGFDTQELVGKDILIVAGGLGLAPVRSLVQYILDYRAEFGSFTLLYGAREPSELLFRDDLNGWSRDLAVALGVTVDRPDEQWRGKTGVVTTLISQLGRLDSHRTRAIVVGPSVMFKFVVMEVLARGVSQKHIYCSLERRMKCGLGKCGHCQVNHVYVCMEGPVFAYADLKSLREALE